MVDDQSQSPAAQFMRCELSVGIAPRANVSVTGTIGTPPPYGPVVLLHFVYSRGLRQFDSKKHFRLVEERGSRDNGPRSSFFMRVDKSAEKNWAGF